MAKRLASERVVIQSPMSFTGSARRAWKLTKMGPSWSKPLTVLAALILIAVWWMAVAVWTFVLGIFIWPWRLLRRGQRRRKQEERRHREMLAAVQQAQRQGPVERPPAFGGDSAQLTDS